MVSFVPRARRLFLALAFLAVLTLPAGATPLVIYEFNVDDMPGSLAIGAFATNFYHMGINTDTMGCPSASYICNGVARFGQVGSTTYSGSRYYGFAVNVVGGGLDLENLSFGSGVYHQPESRQGYVKVAYQADGGGPVVDLGEYYLDQASEGTANIDLAFLPQLAQISFFFYPRDAPGGLSSRMYLDTVTLSGVVVPEPSTLAFALAGLALIGFGRRRG